MAATLTIVNQYGQTLASHRLGNAPFTIRAQDQVQYQLAGEGGLAPANVEAARAGNDLLVNIDGQSALRIEDYFLLDDSGLKNPLLSMNGNGQYVAYAVVESPTTLPAEHVLAEEVASVSAGGEGASISALTVFGLSTLALGGMALTASNGHEDQAAGNQQPQTPFDPNQPQPPAPNPPAPNPPAPNPPTPNPPPAQPQPNGSVTISGEAKVGQTLTAQISDAEGISGSPRYQWLADGQPIQNATQSAYTLTANEKGKAISVQATYSDGKNTAESPVSAATAPIADPAQPGNEPGAVSIHGRARVGETLSATLVDSDGIPADDKVQYQWFADGKPIANATRSTYTLSAADKGKQITVQASYTDDKGHPEAPQSEATAAVTDPMPPAPNGAVMITGNAQVGEILHAAIFDDNNLDHNTLKYQ